MMKSKISITVLVLLTACQATPPPVRQPAPNRTWVASVAKDEFTDVVTKMVTVGSFSYNGTTFTQVGKYYPFIGKRGSTIYVGIRSGGVHRIPTGTVQIRVDDNSAWTITPEETPADLIPGTAPSTSAAPGMSAEMMANMSKILSPYTAATGEKAKSIIKQMLSGKIIKYRTVGLNQAASTTGEVAVDQSLVESLQSIGINPEEL